jgi:phosphoesterase RecJ-like protein
VSLKKLVDALKANNNFVITSHVNPEGDALGSELALGFLLRKLGKTVTIINEDRVPASYSFLPGKENIRLLRYNPKRRINFGCLVFIDCSDERRTGEVYRINRDHKPVINIDHHISNEKFGDINWIQPQASSCSEMVYELYKKMKIPFDREAALCLYTGMVSDTGSFRYTNTHSSTHKAAAELLGYGIEIPQVYRSIYENIPMQDIRLLLRILPTMRFEAKGKIIWFQIKQNLLRNMSASFDLTEALLGFARTVSGVEVVALFKQNLGVRDEVRINLRSQGKVDVNIIASHFGGGGHKTASGATIHGKIESIRKKVLARIRQALKNIP